jgi:hypothetical protein
MRAYLAAGVAKLVDAADSKSAGAKHRAGSIPASGTTLFFPHSRLVFFCRFTSAGMDESFPFRIPCFTPVQ